MSIRHPTNCSVQSVTDEVQQSFHCLQREEEVVKCRNFNAHVSAQGIEARGTPFPMVLTHETAKPPLLNI